MIQNIETTQLAQIIVGSIFIGVPLLFVLSYIQFSVILSPIFGVELASLVYVALVNALAALTFLVYKEFKNRKDRQLTQELSEQIKSIVHDIRSKQK